MKVNCMMFVKGNSTWKFYVGFENTLHTIQRIVKDRNTNMKINTLRN